MIQTKLFPSFTDLKAMLLDPRRRFTVRLLVRVENGIINGDPDTDKNRIDPHTGHGLATDVSAKRDIRDTGSFLLGNGYEVKPGKDDKYVYDKLYIEHRGVLNANNEEVYRACGVETGQKVELGLTDALVAKMVTDGVPSELPGDAYSLVLKDEKWMLVFDGTLDTETRGEMEAAFESSFPGSKGLVKKLHGKSKPRTLSDTTLTTLNTKLADMYRDTRMFGAVASTGNSCGNVKGPWQFGYGRSIDPIECVNNTLTRCAITKIEDKEKKRQDMGKKNPILYSLFSFTATYSPHLASRVGSKGVTSEDLRLFWTALYNYGRLRPSAMRGHIEAVGIYVFVHDHPLGNEHDHVLQNRIQVTRREDVEHGRKDEDYVISVNDHDLPEGITLIKFYEPTVTTTIPAPIPAVIVPPKPPAADDDKPKGTK